MSVTYSDHRKKELEKIKNRDFRKYFLEKFGFEVREVLKCYQEVMKTSKQYSLEELLLLFSEIFRNPVEIREMKELAHYLSELGCINTADGKTFFKTIGVVKDLDVGENYSLIKIISISGRKLRIKNGFIRKVNQQKYLYNFNSGKKFCAGEGTKIVLLEK